MQCEGNAAQKWHFAKQGRYKRDEIPHEGEHKRGRAKENDGKREGKREHKWGRTGANLTLGEGHQSCINEVDDERDGWDEGNARQGSAQFAGRVRTVVGYIGWFAWAIEQLQSESFSLVRWLFGVAV